MAAEADKAADAAKDDEGTNEVAPEDCYSAYAARRDIQPNLQFRHMLSRFTFQIKPGTDDAKNVEVTGIKIKANTKGFLCVVGDNKGTVIPCAVDEENNPLVDMELQQRSVAGQCEPLEPVSLTEASAEAPVTAGESIMAMAGETSYDIVISTRMNEASGIKTPIADLEKKLTLSENAQFAAGTSYNVTITVYSLEKIEVTATLAEWADGEDITIGEDEDQKPSGN